MGEGRVLKIEALGSLCLEADAIAGHAERCRDTRANCARMGTDLGRGQNQAGVDVGQGVTRVPHPLQRFAQGEDGIRALPFRIQQRPWKYTTQGVLWGLKNGEGQGFQPKAVMLMIGTNNTAANTAPEIAEGVGAVVLELRKDFPDAKILLLAIFPRSLPGDPVRDKIADVNRIISKLDDQRHVFYMDIGAKFLDESGKFLPDSFRADNLHPQAKGYDIWGTAVKDKIAELMK